MSAGNWSAIDLTGDPVRGEPGEVRALANASQQEAARWDQQAQALRALADEGANMEMTGDFAPKARQVLQSHPTDARPLAQGRKDAGQALLAYATALEQAKRTSQQALARGTQARQAHRQAKMVFDQAVAQMNAMPKVVPAPQYPYVLQQFNMLRARAQQASQAMQQAEMQWKAARQQAIQAGQQAAQQERVAAERVMAAAPKPRAGGGGGGGSGNGAQAATGGGATGAGGAAAATGRGGSGAGGSTGTGGGGSGSGGSGGTGSRGRDVATPTLEPSPHNVASGTPETLKGNPSDQMLADVATQNENANVLARQGYDVHHQPKDQPPHIDREGARTSADYRIGDRYYEHKVVHTDNVTNFYDNNLEKGATAFQSKGTQAERFVVDLSSGQITPEQLRAEIAGRVGSEQGTGVKEVIAILNGKVIPIYP